ncbi:hypothetical protein BDV93DRAFT_518242 [Ceratobasidium sp. AG-I]|nr:hypothetical protein BDV93DRAFT_518242 [Ceratobasidium sp. AG-I]
MSVTPLSLRGPRALIPHDISHTSTSPLSLRRDAIECDHEFPYTTSNEIFPHGSLRLPADNINKPVARPRAYYPGLEKGTSCSLIYPRTRSISPLSCDSSISRASPVDISGDDLDSQQREITGPIRVPKSHSRRQPPGHIPRPRNAFILYRSWYVREGFLADVESDHREISRIVGKIWKELPESERARWRALAEKEKKEHAEKYPNYKYSPNSRRDGAPPPVRSAPLRSSAARARKAKPATAPIAPNRNDDIAKVFLTGSRKASLTERVRDLDQKRAKEELETGSKRHAPALNIKVPPRSELIDIEASSTPQSSPALPELSYGSSTSDSAATPNEEHTGFVCAQPSPVSDVRANDDPAWSLAACSAPLSDPEFAFESDASLPTSSHHSYDSDVSPSWPFRVGFDGGEMLNRIASCQDSTDGHGLLNYQANDWNAYQSSVSLFPVIQHPMHPEPELSPFDRIALEGTEAGHPGASTFGVPGWNGPFQTSSTYATSSTSHDTMSTYDTLSNFSWAQGSVSAEHDYTPSDASNAEVQATPAMGEEQAFRDCGMFSEWCNPDSPLISEGIDSISQTPSSASSGPSSPPPAMAYPAPMYPLRSGLLCSAWETTYEDLDDYEHAIGGIKAEVGGHGVLFGTDGLMEVEGERV